MKFRQTLVYLITNISNMFLSRCWRLETSSRPFYDFNEIRGEWPSGLRRCNMIRKVSGSNPLDVWPGLGTQPRYEAPGDLRVDYVQKTQ